MSTSGKEREISVELERRGEWGDIDDGGGNAEQGSVGRDNGY